MATAKDLEQDRIIQANAERIARNEEAIKRQTEALEKIRDHYYPQQGWFKKSTQFVVKVICIIVAYLGIAETVDWILTTRESESLAAQYAKVGHQLFFEDGNGIGAVQCYEKAVELDGGESKYKLALTFMKGIALSAEFIGQIERPMTKDECAQVSSALAEANMLAELEPKNPMPLVLKAQSLLLLGDYATAAEVVEAAVARDSQQAPVRLSACAINLVAGNHARARQHLATAEQLNPALPLVQYWKGMIALKLDHDVALAKACFTQMTKIRPRLAIGHAMLGRALLSEAKPDLAAARAAFNKALAIDFKQKLAMQGMADSYEREGNLLVARIWLTRTLQIDGNFIPSLVARARINCKLGDCATAVDDLTAAIAIAPFRPDLYAQRAAAYEHGGDAAKAKTDRDTVKALNLSVDADATERVPPVDTEVIRVNKLDH